MLRRLATLLLTLSVTFAGLLAKPHAAACCIVRQAPAHHCCKPATQLRISDCCRGNHQLMDRVVHSQPAPQQTLPLALLDPPAEGVPPATVSLVALPLTLGLAPPGSLIAQHTSLLV